MFLTHPAITMVERPHDETCGKDRATSLRRYICGGACSRPLAWQHPCKQAPKSIGKGSGRGDVRLYGRHRRAISLFFDTDLEIVTKDSRSWRWRALGRCHLSRPDKLHVTRHGGFADVEAIFDGKTLSLIGRNANVYGQVDVPGSIDHLIDELRDEYHRPVPGADLLQSNLYDALMPQVTDVKDLGSGVIGGVECDHLAFRTDEVDWQIWIAQGARPYPCRYVITSKLVDDGPQYSVQIRDWKTGNEVASDDYSFKNSN